MTNWKSLQSNKNHCLVLLQEECEKVESEQDMTVNKVAVKESKGKVMRTEVFGNGATSNDCSFILHM